MYPVSRIVDLIFVAVFEGPIMLLTTVKFIFMQYQYIHCSTSLYVHTPSLKKYNFCHIQIYLSLAGKGLKHPNEIHFMCLFVGTCTENLINDYSFPFLRFNMEMVDIEYSNYQYRKFDIMMDR